MVLKSCYKYSFDTGKWEKISDMNEGRVFFSSTFLESGKDIMVVGGYDGENVLTSSEKLNIEKGVWEKCEGITDKRLNLAAINHNGSVYIFGGVNDKNEILSQIERYD